MAYEEKSRIGRRSSRFGSRPSSRLRARHTSRGVLPLNDGASPHGSKNVLRMGGRGGGFGSGRPAGGGAGAGSLAAALSGGAAAPSVMGTPEIGPPPIPLPPPSETLAMPPSMWPNNVTGPTQPVQHLNYPTFDIGPTQLARPPRFPIFTPEPEPIDIRFRRIR